MTYRIRRARCEDAPFLADVSLAALLALGGPPVDFNPEEWKEGFISWTEEQVRGGVPFSTTSVIEVDQEPVGRLRIVRDGQCIELAGIQLMSDVQGRGIGTGIVETLKTEAERSGLPLELSVERDNPRARALYVRLGFVKIRDDGDEERFRWQGRR